MSEQQKEAEIWTLSKLHMIARKKNLEVTGAQQIPYSHLRNPRIWRACRNLIRHNFPHRVLTKQIEQDRNLGLSWKGALKESRTVFSLGRGVFSLLMVSSLYIFIILGPDSRLASSPGNILARCCPWAQVSRSGSQIVRDAPGPTSTDTLEGPKFPWCSGCCRERSKVSSFCARWSPWIFQYLTSQESWVSVSVAFLILVFQAKLWNRYWWSSCRYPGFWERCWGKFLGFSQSTAYTQPTLTAHIRKDSALVQFLRERREESSLCADCYVKGGKQQVQRAVPWIFQENLCPHGWFLSRSSTKSTLSITSIILRVS